MRHDGHHPGAGEGHQLRIAARRDLLTEERDALLVSGALRLEVGAVERGTAQDVEFSMSQQVGGPDGRRRRDPFAGEDGRELGVGRAVVRDHAPGERKHGWILRLAHREPGVRDFGHSALDGLRGECRIRRCERRRGANGPSQGGQRNKQARGC